MRHTRKPFIAGALIMAVTLAPALSPAAGATGRPATRAMVTIDRVGLIVPANGNRYSTALRLKQYGAFIALYHTSYTGVLKAHVSIDRDHRTIYRAMMANTGSKTRPYFYAWTQFRIRSQAGHLVAYITIQAGASKVTKPLLFTLNP